MDYRRHIVFGAAAIALMTLEMNGMSLAQSDVGSAGSSVLSTFKAVITGTIGTIIGLGLALLGLWTWIVKQETAAGITMILGGVAITMLPNIFGAAQSLVTDVLGNFTMTDGSARTN